MARIRTLKPDSANSLSLMTSAHCRLIEVTVGRETDGKGIQ